jgi:hypothetical protein
MERDAGDEMVRELFLNPATAGDGDESPLLEQARKNVEEQTLDNLEHDRARRAERDEGPGPHKKTP